MRVYRGRSETVEDDWQVTGTLLDIAAETGEPAVRVWRPHRQVAFGPRDVTADGYDGVRQVALDRGFETVERRVGGRAVAYTGSTVAFARCVPLDDHRTGLDDRYESMVDDVLVALDELGVDPWRGEPDGSFCPGGYSLSAAGKLVGIAQRVRSHVALVSGVAVVRDHDEIATVLEPIYDGLDVPFEPRSVGSIARAGGPADPATVRAALEYALCGTRPHTLASIHDV
jgi:lipoate-protein ligase A